MNVIEVINNINMSYQDWIHKMRGLFPQIFDLIVIVVISCIPLLWIPEGKILTGHDSGYPINVQEAYKNRFFSWNSQDSFGLDNTTSLSVIPVLSIQALVSSMGLSVAASEVVTFIFWFFVMQIAMYIFASSLRDTIQYRWFPLVASLLYVFNYYLLALWRYGAGTTFSAYAALPLLLTCLLGVIREKIPIFRAAVTLSLILFFFNGGGGLSLPLFGGLLISVVWAIIYFVVVTERTHRRSLVQKIIRFSWLTALISLILNAYWVFPFIYYVITNYYTELSAKGGKAVVLKWTDSVSIYTSISNLFRLQGYPDWYGNPYHPYANQILQKKLFIIGSMLFAPIAYLAMLVVKQIEQKRLVLYFTGLSLLGVFFSAGSHPPTGWLYSLFMLYVPGFVVFRSAQYKFIPALFLSFAILISFTLNYIIFEGKFFKSLRSSSQKIISLCFIIIFIFGLASYHYPYFQRGFFYYTKSLSTLIHVPGYVYRYDAWSKDNFDDDGRTLILPKFNSTWKAALYDWGYFSLYSPFNLITPKPFVQHSYYLNESQAAIFNRLTMEIVKNTPLAKKLLGMFQIRHILLAGDIKYTTEDMPGESPYIYKAVLSNTSRYKSVWRDGPWEVYKIPEYANSKIFGVSALTAFHGAPGDVIGAILVDKWNFMLPNVVGKATVNPPLESLPIVDSIRSLTCFTCDIFTQTADITPSYTNILPGSVFYGLKRWRENSSSNIRKLPQSDVLFHLLGLSQKRLSELIGLSERFSKHDLILQTVQELDDEWSSILVKLPKDAGSNDDVKTLMTVYGYAVSELRISKKITQDYPDLSSVLVAYIQKLDQAVVHIDGLKKKYENRMSYKMPGQMKRGMLYLDVDSLARDMHGNQIMPKEVEVAGRTFQLSQSRLKQNENNRLDLGEFDISMNDTVTLVFPQVQSMLGSYVHNDLNVDGKKQSCYIAKIEGFLWKRSYKLEIENASEFAKTTQIYFQKHKISKPFLIDGSVSRPDYAFNFDRAKPTSQDLYFSGAEGDIEAYIYQCSDVNDSYGFKPSNVKVSEVVKPVLFVYQGDHKEEIRQNIQYNRINQTKYVINLSASSFPMILVFNENFNDSWRLSTNDSTKDIWTIMRKWIIPSYQNSNHLELNGYANAWYIKEKPVGEVVLEFFPQSLFYKGVIISVTGVLFVCIYMLYRRKN